MASLIKMSDSFYGAFSLSYLCLISCVTAMPIKPSMKEASLKSSQFYSCIQNCANCVQFWAHGLYNGQRCAKSCLQERDIVDPDCNNPQMFNYSPHIIDLLLESQSSNQQTVTDKEMQSDQPAKMQITKRNGLTWRNSHRHRHKNYY